MGSEEKELLFDKVVEIIKKRGPLICGGCYRIRAGELHCKPLARELDVSTGVIWDIVKEGIRKGIIVREVDKSRGVVKYCVRNSNPGILIEV